MARGLVATRSRARDLVLRGAVVVDGSVRDKPADMVADTADIRVAEALAAQVSRAAGKLEAGLTAFGVSANGLTALDIGASTGGFTQTLLAGGAARVYAVDVGHGQLHPSLVADSRVRVLEGCDARALDRALVPDDIGAIVADVSFISLAKALPAGLALASAGAWLIALVKPQFEVGREGVAKGGIVRDEALRARAVADVARFLAESGWRVRGHIESPLPGRDGNVEFLIGADRHA